MEGAIIVNRISTLALALAVCVGTTAMLKLNQKTGGGRQTMDARLASDGAFRDGLYVGRLAAQQRLPMHSPVGRWSTEKDRWAFEAGYRHGYSAFLSNAVKE